MMAHSLVLRGADASTLKRSLTALDDGAVRHPSDPPSSTCPDDDDVRARIPDYAVLLAGLRSPWRMSHPLDESRRPSFDLVPRGTAGDRTAVEHANPLPSLLSILAAAPAMTGCGVGPRAQVEAPAAAVTAVPLAPLDRSQASRIADENRFRGRHHAQASISTLQSTDSTDSSPTTTISTVDSSSVTDSSPGSSPESPTSSLPLASAPSKPPPPRLTEDPSLAPPLSPFFGQNGPLSPGRRPRNTKNLSLNMSAPTRQFPPPALRIKTASAADTLQSAPPSPSAATGGMRPPKKRPSHLGLSVRTATIAAAPSGTGSTGPRIVPPSPRSPRPNTLRHHQSSPALSLFSPTMGVPGGMQLPPFNPQRSMGPPALPSLSQSRSRPTSSDSGPCFSDQASPIAPARLEELEEEGEDDYGVPLSQEVKSSAYPAGPVCIYDPHVYLYLEPSNEEASQFDVILNVAREVKNPFAHAGDPPRTGVVASGDGSWDDATSRSSSTSDSMSGTAASDLMLDHDPVASPVPLTAKPPPFEARSTNQGPEYIHIPWEHNSNIVDDMLNLVELIDERVRQGKRVLVHCQCGVSRSASLIVAYGLYRDPSLTVQEVYDAVKRKSRWIGPNMSLIYQLSEFRTKMIQRRGLATANPRTWRGGAGIKAGSTANGRANTLPGGSDPPLFAVGPFEGRRSAPQTAPLPGEHERGSGRSSPDKAETLRPVRMEGHGDVAPGPSSAPSGGSWEGMAGATEARDAPCRSGSDMLPRMNPPAPLHAPPREAPSEDSRIANGDGPTVMAAPAEHGDLSLMSPRASSFTANLLHEPPPAAPAPSSTLGFRTGIPVDPRSPAHRGEAPIVRSIFDVL